MLYTVGIILPCSALPYVDHHDGFIHLLLVAAIVVVLIRVIQGRRVL